jgi:outer membrane protein assembly factor BamA
MRFSPVLAAVLLLVAAGHAVAQDTRAEWLEQQRAERAQTLAAYRPNIAERTLLYVEDKRILEQLSAGWHGLYPRVGGFTTGSGFAMGAGYRHAVPGTTQMEVDASAAFSTRGYKGVDLRLRAPALLDGLLHLDSAARWWDYTQEDFFGIGESSRVNRSSYRYEALAFNLGASLRPRRWLAVGVDLGHLRPAIRTGTDPRFPSIEQRFTDREAPGLTRQSPLLTARTFVDLDYRDQPANPRAGGRLLIEFGGARDQHASREFSHRRTDISLQHILPIFDKKRAFVVRVAAAHVDPVTAGGRVPFFMAPTLGGSTTLRSYRELRFRDASYVVVNGEYRWEAFSALDLALFWDGGDVGARLEDLRLKDFRSGWGVGLRFNTNRAIFLRTDVGFGGTEGPRLFVKFGPAF